MEVVMFELNPKAQGRGWDKQSDKDGETAGCVWGFGTLSGSGRESLGGQVVIHSAACG